MSPRTKELDPATDLPRYRPSLFLFQVPLHAPGGRKQPPSNIPSDYCTSQYPEHPYSHEQVRVHLIAAIQHLTRRGNSPRISMAGTCSVTRRRRGTSPHATLHGRHERSLASPCAQRTACFPIEKARQHVRRRCLAPLAVYRTTPDTGSGVRFPAAPCMKPDTQFR